MARILWYSDTLSTGMAGFIPALKEQFEDELSNFAELVERYMKENAPWEDRTGDARSGLVAEEFNEISTMGISLEHSVDYGIWLEVRWNGKYAIIIPTLEVMGPALMASLTGIIERTDDGLI